MKSKKKNFLNNRDILREIHLSKTSYCYFKHEKYANYDAIVANVSEVDDTVVKQIIANRIKQLKDDFRIVQKEKGVSKNHYKKVEPTEKDIDINSFIIRVLTYEHIPLDPSRKVHPKTEADSHVKLNFTPFKHYIIQTYRKNRKKVFVDIKLEEVGRSHWKGGLTRGFFTVDNGKITNTLATMFLKLVEKYGTRGNWRGYSYRDEMEGQALFQLCAAGLQFDENKSENPFSYYTQMMSNSFTRIFNIEKRGQMIRDDILIMNKQNPSHTREVENQMKQREDNAKSK